ncbi:response regulator [Halolactibacillus sp. JCM 19043]|uniref:response regulator n=1 Tax=Halolactibacillus sp. JCM 19043 TaxID=1460638 RepID=UPI00078186D2|nr:response regulator [Halolactibacillus sp. JCM 19043]
MKVCIFDDETMAIDFLTHQLKKLANIHILFTSTTPYLDDHTDTLKQIDVVFLDIEMPEVDGLSLAEQLNEQYPHIHIVFVSAHKSYAIEAFELSALDYLLKPVQLNRLKKTIKRIEQQLPPNNTILSENRQLLIQVLGSLEFIMDDASITATIQWRTSKSKEVFLFLLHHAGDVLSKSKMVETLWPDVDPDKGFANLYVNIYNVRKSLKPFSHFITIANIDQGYAVKLNHAKVDKHLWCAFFNKSTVLTDATQSEYQRHLDMYKGVYLAELDYIWLKLNGLK